ncbi:MAG: NAD(P)-binding domain-containing protein [Thermoproteus sp.]
MILTLTRMEVAGRLLKYDRGLLKKGRPYGPMVRVFRQGRAELLRDKTVAVIGYGNVGRSIALNLRDSGLSVLVGDLLGSEYARRAKADGLEPRPIPEAAELGDVVVLALPDDAAPEIYRTEVLPGLHSGKALVLTSGFPAAYGLLQLPGGVDVALFVPKAPGPAIRDRYLQGRGYAAVVGVVEDVSGSALDVALAVADGAGAFKQGGFAVEASAREEALADLLGEQILKASLLAAIEVAFELMTKAGVPQELAAVELYGSGELGELGRLMSLVGPYGALRLQSPVDAYGQLARAGAYRKAIARVAARVLEEILGGDFPREIYLERAAGYVKFNALWRSATASELAQADARLRAALRQGP